MDLDSLQALLDKIETDSVENEIDFERAFLGKKASEKKNENKNDGSSLASKLNLLKNCLLDLREKVSNLNVQPNNGISKFASAYEIKDDSVLDTVVLSGILKLAEKAVEEAKKEMEKEEEEDKMVNEDKEDTSTSPNLPSEHEEDVESMDMKEEEGEMVTPSSPEDEGGMLNEDDTSIHDEINNIVDELFGEATSELESEGNKVEEEGVTPPEEGEGRMMEEEDKGGEEEEEVPVGANEEEEEVKKAAYDKTDNNKNYKIKKEKNNVKLEHQNNEENEDVEDVEDEEECCDEEGMESDELEKMASAELNELDKALKDDGVDNFYVALKDLGLSVEDLEKRAKDKISKIAATKIASEIKVAKMMNKNLGKKADINLKEIIKNYLVKLIN